MDRIIDLRHDIPNIRQLLHEGLAKFESEHPNVRWSCVAMDSAPHFGWVALNFDTREHSNAEVKLFESNGPDWYHEDQWGRCCSNCADFAFVAVMEERFPHWSEWYQGLDVEEDATIIDVHGKERSIALSVEGDNAFAAPVFEMLQLAMKEELERLFRQAKNADEMVRVGVQLCELDGEWFERVPPAVSTTPASLGGYRWD